MRGAYYFTSPVQKCPLFLSNRPDLLKERCQRTRLEPETSFQIELEILDSLALISNIYMQERGRLQSMIRRMTKQDNISEDVVHDAFLRLVQQPHGNVVEVEAWLTRVARNLALNHIRNTSRNPIDVGECDRIEHTASDAPSVERQLIDREQLLRCMRAIMDLPPRRREIFVMHRFHELTYDEIAGRLGISRNTVMVQIVNALAGLHQSMYGMTE